ncbi:LAMI_0E16446g1_1 [Lachancea mirantina]|uniref:LAMI_0E16446g1_1 n=1 Tax=Lachancea mirantina TaxID=1230905 RepID=A0A1G4JT08_9SACH|nr:LAMI_0E16446g1_1 [Lachancea mirantina]
MHHILDAGYGYGFVVGLGAAFAFIMIFVTRVLTKYMGEVQDSEHFSTASRSIKSGLISSAVVSSWCWPGTLLSSCVYTYRYGVAGGYWYGISGISHSMLFTLIALQMKRKATGAHTIVEIVRARYGKAAHCVYLFYSCGTNTIIASMLLLGCSQAFAHIANIHIVACAFLFPVSVAAYTMLGGLKSTFLSDWIHTVVIYLVIIASLLICYCTSDLIGSTDRMWDLLHTVSKTHPSAGHEGSYLTFSNKALVMLAWSQIMSGWATVFADPSYGQKAIAAKPMSTISGYVIGSLCWFIIPWSFGLGTALAALALTNNPVSPTYPHLIPAQEVNMGMPLLYGLYAIMGKSGAAAGILVLFLSCTSSLSAELVSFSSVITYDVYRAYIKPDASGKQLVTVSHISVVAFALFIAGLTIMFNYIGITISWILTFIGIILGAAPVGITLTLFWPKMSTYCFYYALPLGSFTGLGCWLGACKHLYGTVNKDNLGLVNSTIIANFSTFGATVLYCVIISFFFPAGNSLEELQDKFRVADDATAHEKSLMQLDKQTKAKLDRIFKWAALGVFGIWISFTFVLPFPMYGQKYIMSKSFFRGWVVVSIIWLFIAFLYITFYPIYESRSALLHFYRRVVGKEQKASTEVFLYGQEVEGSASSGKASVIEQIAEKRDEDA